MAYNKHMWVARQGVGLNKFTDQNGVKYEFTPSPDEVTQPGTPFSAEWMNEMEEQLEKAAVLSGGAVEGNFPVFNALGELINSGKGPDILQYVNGAFSTLGGTSVDVGNAKIEAGSYIGTGTTTQSLSIPFEPKLLFVGSSVAPERYPNSSPFPAINFYHLAVIGNVGFAMVQYAAYNTANSSSAIAVDVILETNYNDGQLSLTFNNSVNPANGKQYNVSDDTVTARAPYFLGNTKGEAYYYIAIG